MSSSRIDWLYEQKPVATVDVYLGLVGMEQFEICRNFPPALTDVDFLNDSDLARYTELWPQMRAPDDKLILELARILDWGIDRDIETIDRYMRAQAYAEAAPGEVEQAVLHVLHQVLFDVLLWRKEYSKKGFARGKLHQAVQAFRDAATIHANVHI